MDDETLKIMELETEIDLLSRRVKRIQGAVEALRLDPTELNFQIKLLEEAQAKLLQFRTK